MQVEDHVLPRDGGDREVDGALLADGHRVVVADRGAVGDGAAPGGGARGVEEGLHQRGLARAGRSDERDVSDPVRRRCGGGGSGLLVGSLLGHVLGSFVDVPQASTLRVVGSNPAMARPDPACARPIASSSC